MSLPPLDILAHRCDDFLAACEARGIGRGRALAIYRDAYRRGVAREPAHAAIDLPPTVDRIEEGDTVKFILRLADGLETESVIIPMQTRGGFSRTLCVSSQVGCAMGCRFCETAQMGLMKNLSARDIVAQWHAAKWGELETGAGAGAADISNIVFMGMGEPMDNLDAVLEAIGILTDPNGAAIAPANIAVSTVGRAAGIRKYAAFAQREGYRKLKLAVSINAPNDAVRSSIMPINRATPMRELMAAMRAWTAEGTPILIEYVLIPGVNAAPEDAEELAAYLGDLPCKVNVIPYNPRRDSPWPAPDEETIAAFQQRLKARGLLVLRRRTLGRDVMAACGQLGNPHIRRRVRLTANAAT